MCCCWFVSTDQCRCSMLSCVAAVVVGAGVVVDRRRFLSLFVGD